MIKKNPFLFFFCFVPTLIGYGQQRTFTVSNAHAHNDYLQDAPFYKAYNAGFGSVEADVFPVDGMLLVAHSKKEIQPGITLKRLYLYPLLKELTTNKSRHVRLLVDIKEDHELTLKLLQQEIEPLIPYLSTTRENKQLTLLISGKRPLPSAYKNYPGYIFFDDDLKVPHTATEWERVGQVSLSFTNYSAWKGEDIIEEVDKIKLQHTIDSVHHAGKTIRFWAAPDNQLSWKLQVQLGVNLIGTDKINELAEFLRRKSNPD
jgi:glycerophosphoryl diester phosphodiesterase